MDAAPEPFLLLEPEPAPRLEAGTVAGSIGAADYGVGGEAPAIYDISSISNSDLATVIPIAIAVIGILLALVMRSLVAPLYLILSVGLSYLAALGLSVILFARCRGRRAGLLPAVPDVHLPARPGRGLQHPGHVRIREEAQRLPLNDAVSHALTATGTTVTSAGLVLGGTFSSSPSRAPGRDPPVPGHRPRPHDRHPDGHLPGPNPDRALDGRPARPVELVAVGDEPGPGRPARRFPPG